MFSFFRKAPKEEESLCVLALDGYSASAAVVKVYRREGSVQHPVIMFSTERVLQAEDDPFLAARAVLEKARSYDGSVDHIVCLIGNPWTLTVPRSFAEQKKQPFKVTRKLLDDMISRDFSAFHEDVVREFGDGEPLGVSDQSDPVVSANGYRVEDALGETVVSLGVSRSLSLVPESVAAEIADVVLDVFHREDVVLGSLHIAALDHAAHAQSGTYVLDGGTSSSIFQFKQGALVRTLDIPFGTSQLEESAASLFDVPRARVASSLRFASDQNLIHHHRDLYYQRIESAYHPLGNAVREGLLELASYGNDQGSFLTFVSHVPWAETLRPLLERDAASPVDILVPDTLDRQVVYGHNARFRSALLSLAVLRAVRKISSLS